VTAQVCATTITNTNNQSNSSLGPGGIEEPGVNRCRARARIAWSGSGIYEGLYFVRIRATSRHHFEETDPDCFTGPDRKVLQCQSGPVKHFFGRPT
jgi:hypothetical protein